MAKFQQFICDPRLAFVTETLKKSNDIFNIITPLENQHSEILKWLFDPRDGHGQGDAIFKDFLTAAYSASEGNVESNKIFFETWKPSRIACTGFHSVFAIREYVLPSNKRLDLLMIDMVNKILIIVENKHGSKLGKMQLSNYYKEVSEVIRRRPVFKDFVTAHIVLDRNNDLEKIEENSIVSQWNRWAFLDYAWLKAGANRAESQLKRGNQSAGLVIAYCQKQSDYTPPDEEKIDDVFANLAGDYQQVINNIYTASKIDVSDLTPTNMKNEQGDLWNFANHYPEILERLKDKVALSYIVPLFRKKFPGTKFMESNGQRWLNLFDNTWNSITADDAKHWSIYLCIWEDRKNEEEEQKFIVMASYHPWMVSDEYRDSLTNSLKEVFPELGKGRQGAGRRCLGRVSGLSQNMIESSAIKLYEQLRKAIAPILPHNIQ